MHQDSVLFVFDPDKSQSQIQEMFAQCQQEFTCSQVISAAEAKKKMEATKYGFVISSLELPDMSGLEFIQFVKKNHSSAVRIIYAEQLEKEILYKSAGYVHQYISSSGQAKRFINILKNTAELKKILSNEKLHSKLTTISHLPSPPEIYNQLMTELQKDDVSIRNVAELIKKDVSITAKLLQIVNSAFFGIASHVESPLHAVNLLGLDTVKSIVLTAGVFNQFQVAKLPGFSIESIYSNSLQVGTSARHLANAFGFINKQTDEALMAGMLHDIGKLVMLSYFPDEFQQALLVSKKKTIPLFLAEKEVMGITDAEIGAHLLSLWGLPHSILEAIAQHYSPGQIPAPITNVSTVVHIGYAVQHDLQNNIKDGATSAFDMEYLNKLNLDTDIDSLKNFCMAAVV